MKQKYQLLINKRQSVGLRHCFDLKAFIKYFNDMRDIYEDIDKYNQSKTPKILILFDDVIVDMLSNKNLNPIFIRPRKSNISFVSIT